MRHIPYDANRCLEIVSKMFNLAEMWGLRPDGTNPRKHIKAGKKGWGIFFNCGIGSQGRINYTLAHEFGHYLMHRNAFPNGIRCGDQDVVRWDSEYG